MSHEPVLKAEAHQRTRVTKPDFNVVIVYDDRNAASRAMKVLSGLVRQFGDDFEFRCDLWRFDVLALPKAREAAVAAGNDGDLIIVSTRGDTDLPPPVKDWLDQSVTGRSPGAAALVALLESQQGLSDTQCRTRQFLRNAADRGLMDFFLREVDLPQTGLRLTPDVLEERANTVSALLQSILHHGESLPRSWRPGVRGWGFNE